MTAREIRNNLIAWLTIIAFSLILLTQAWMLAQAQTSMGPIRTPQVNQDIYVGQTGYASIQSAITYACKTGNRSFNVIVQTGMTPPDTPTAVTGGCSGTTITDQRNVPPNLYTWNGTVYVLVPPSGGGGGIAKTYNLLAGDNTGQAIDSGAKVAQGGGMTASALNQQANVAPGAGVASYTGHYFNCNLQWVVGYNAGTNCFTSIDQYSWHGYNYGWGGVMSNIAASTHAAIGGADGTGYSYRVNSSGITSYQKGNQLWANAGDINVWDFNFDLRPVWIRGSDENYHTFRFSPSEYRSLAGTVTQGSTGANKILYNCAYGCLASELSTPVLDLNTMQSGQIGDCTNINVVGLVKNCAVTGVTMPQSAQGTLASSIDIPPSFGDQSPQQNFKVVTITLNVPCDVTVPTCASSTNVSFWQGPFLEVMHPTSVGVYSGGLQTFTGPLYYSHNANENVCVGGFNDGFVEQANVTLAHQTPWHSINAKVYETYQKGDLVTYNNVTYVSLTNNNKGLIPDHSPGQWLAVQWAGGFNPLSNYGRGQMVSFRGQMYYSLTNGNLRHDPGSRSGAGQWDLSTVPAYRYVERVLCSPTPTSVIVGDLRAGNMAEFFGSNYSANFYLGGTTMGVVDDAGNPSTNTLYLDGNSAPWAIGDEIQQVNHISAFYNSTLINHTIVNPWASFSPDSESLSGGGALFPVSNDSQAWKVTHNNNSPALYAGGGSGGLGLAPFLWYESGPTSGYYFDSPPLASGTYGTGAVINVGHSQTPGYNGNGGTNQPYAWIIDHDTGVQLQVVPASHTINALADNLNPQYDLTAGHVITANYGLVAGFGNAGQGGDGSLAGVEHQGLPGYNIRQWWALNCLASNYGGSAWAQEFFAPVQTRDTNFPYCATATGGVAVSGIQLGPGIGDLLILHDSAPNTARLDVPGISGGGSLILNNISIGGSCTIGGLPCSTGTGTTTSSLSAYPTTSSGRKSSVVATTPPNTIQTCRKDAMWHDDNYIYVCIRNHTIKRASLQAFAANQ